MTAPHATLVGHTASVHLALRRVFDRLVEHAVAGSLPPGQLLAGIAAGVTSLRAHHQFEDELLLPLLRDKGAEGPWDQVADEHEQLAGHLATLDQAVERSDARAVLAPLQAIQAMLPAHLALEEDQLTERFWSGVLTEDEAKAFGKAVAAHSREHLKPAPKLLPLLLYNLDDVERARFTDRMPAFVVNGLVPVAFRPAWRGLRPFMTYPPRRWTRFGG
jgi:hypothetical protein